jgi:uncharacterized protein with gpF-like domain
MPINLKPVQPRDAIAALIERGKQLEPSFDWQEIYADMHARAFTVAKSAGFDVLEDIFNALLKALDEGKTYRQFADELVPVLQSKGWWGRQIVSNPNTGLPASAQLGSPRRLQTIFDVNMRVSYAVGHWTSFERNKAARPFLRYVHLEGQENPRLQHAAWHNIVLPVDDPWWNTHACPNGWGCHCTLQSLAQRDIDMLLSQGVGLRFAAPAEHLVPWENKSTGETRYIDRGIDPGWDHNPGKDGWSQTLDRLAAKPDPLDIRG